MLAPLGVALANRFESKVYSGPVLTEALISTRPVRVSHESLSGVNDR